MNRLALGTVQFGLAYGIANSSGQVAPTEAAAMLSLASEMDVDTLDTAIGYGDSEARLGQIGVEHFNLITKLPPVPGEVTDVGEWLCAQTHSSLKRLGVRKLHGLLLHKPSQLLAPRGIELYKALLEQKEAGLVAKIGVSIYSPNELDALCSSYAFDLVQAPFNLIDQRLKTSGWLSRLKQLGVEVHTRSAFLQGLLLMQPSDRPVYFRRWSHLWEIWDSWLKINDGPAIHTCLSYVLSNPEVDRVIVGADSTVQLRDILAAGSHSSSMTYPIINSDEEDLINPSRWIK
jgi:aryl-alcohol dehydrogenase-like predicted oxidoreductase